MRAGEGTGAEADSRTVSTLRSGFLAIAGVTTVALTPSGDTDLRRLDRRALGPGPVAVVVGAEGAGLSAAALEAAHHRVAIPMATGVDSLNVATAAAVALHHLAGVSSTR